MVAAMSSIHESDDRSQALLHEVVQRFTDLLIAGGATISMITSAMSRSIERAADSKASTTFTDLGSLLRDCMEVMCVWRRDPELVGQNGEPLALPPTGRRTSFEALCKKAGCRHSHLEILNALLEFGAVARDDEGLVRSETPTFLIGASAAGGRIATDGLIKHLQGFLRCVHRNVCSVSGSGKARFDRLCTVTVAAELEPVFDHLVRRRGQEFIDSIDEWLERNTKLESPSGSYVELGAGAYFIDLGMRQGRKSLPREGNNSL